MLDKIISKARRILMDAQKMLTVESAAAVEQVYNDIVALNDFIDKELYAVENNRDLDEISKKAARRVVYEQAGRKLEILKARRNYSDTSEALEEKLAGKLMEDDDSLLRFFREKEVRDRLFDMTETQILSIFGESLIDGSNPLLANAILNAPPGFEPVSKETLLKVKQSVARKHSPEVADELEIVRNLNSMVAKIFGLVKTELDNLRHNELPTALTQSHDRPFKF